MPANPPKGSREPWIDQTRMLVLPNAVPRWPGMSGTLIMGAIATSLLNRVVAIAASGEPGVPYDPLLLHWLIANHIEERHLRIDGESRLAIHPGSQLMIMFGTPDRWREAS